MQQVWQGPLQNAQHPLDVGLVATGCDAGHGSPRGGAHARDRHVANTGSGAVLLTMTTPPLLLLLLLLLLFGTALVKLIRRDGVASPRREAAAGTASSASTRSILGLEDGRPPAGLDELHLSNVHHASCQKHVTRKSGS